MTTYSKNAEAIHDIAFRLALARACGVEDEVEVSSLDLLEAICMANGSLAVQALLNVGVNLDTLRKSISNFRKGPSKRTGDLRPIQVWSEGYAATGESEDATCHGTFMARDFDDAVTQWMATLDQRSKDCVHRRAIGVWTFRACRLFDNEAQAREAIG